MTTRFEVSRTIAAPPTPIFDVLRSPEGHVAIDASGMLMSSTGSPAGAVGDRFTVHMDHEALNDFPLGLYDVDVVITAFDPSGRSPGRSRGSSSPTSDTSTATGSSRSTAGPW